MTLKISRACNSAISTNISVWSRTRADIGPQNASLNRAVSRASASPSAAYLPILPGSGKLPAAIERTLNPIALAAGSFISRGQRLIHEFLRAVKAPGSPLLRSLVQHPQKSGRSVFHAFSLSPVLSSSVLHVINMHQEQDRDHGKSIHKHG